MTHASLFSGIGGFDLAAKWAWFIGVIMTVIGITIIYYEGYGKGLKRGSDITIETITTKNKL